MSESDRRRFERYVSRLTPDEVLVLHRIVSRAAQPIYAPMHAARQRTAYRDAMAAFRAGR